jgi:hypothetical protein
MQQQEEVRRSYNPYVSADKDKIVDSLRDAYDFAEKRADLEDLAKDNFWDR